MTEDEKKGISWYNSLTKYERKFWLEKSKTYIPADAWKAYKADRLGF